MTDKEINAMMRNHYLEYDYEAHPRKALPNTVKSDAMSMLKSLINSWESKKYKRTGEDILNTVVRLPVEKYKSIINEVLNEYPDLLKDFKTRLIYNGIDPTSIIETKSDSSSTSTKRFSTEEIFRALLKVQIDEYLKDKSADNAEFVLDSVRRAKDEGISIAQYNTILSDIKKRYPEMENPEMDDLIVDITETVAKPKTKRQRKPMSQEQKDKLTERLRLAREAKRAQKALEEAALYDTMGRKWEFGMDFNNDGTIEDEERVEGITHDYVYVCKSAIFMRYVREIESGEYGDLAVRPMTKAGLFRISIPPATLDEAVRKMRTSEMEFIDSGNTYAEAIEKARISDAQLKRIFRLAVRMAFERQTQ